MAPEGSSMPFIQNLASSDRKLRESALASLRTFLSSRHSTTALMPLDILKLWKGLFYALWMADRAIPQQNLCTDLAALLGVVDGGGSNDDAAIQWLRGFWATMAREWTGIDVLRMEKFLLLVRRMLGASLGWMRRGGAWDQSRVERALGVLEEWPLSAAGATQEEDEEDEDVLSPRGKTVPAGLKVHVLDVWVDEAERVGLLEEEDRDALGIVKRIDELVRVLEKDPATATSVKVRSRDARADARLPWNMAKGGGIEGHGSGDDDVADDESWDGFT